ncbi:hypothetical protein ACPXCF_04935 [Streptomyces sp. DT171]
MNRADQPHAGPDPQVGGTQQRDHPMKKARSYLLTLLLAALTIRVLWWVVEPFIPYMIGMLAIVMVLGFVYYRMTRW